MARRITEHDWASTPLGEPGVWPVELLDALRLILPSRVPMFLWYGDQLTYLYNDAHLDVLGDKHPGALGRPASEVWSEIWDVIEPLAREVVDDGATTWSQDLPLHMERHGFLEETYFTFSYSPCRDGRGHIVGLFCATFETTGRVISERRLTTLRSLGEALAATRTVNDVTDALSTVLAGHQDVPATAVYLLDGDRARRGAATGGFVTALPEAVALDAQGAVRGLSRSGSHRGEVVPISAWTDRPVDGGSSGREIEHVAVRQLRDHATGACVGWFVAGLQPCRPIDDDVRSFVGLVADQLRTGLSNARVRHRLHRAEQRELERSGVQRQHLVDRVAAALSECRTADQVATRLFDVATDELSVAVLGVYTADDAPDTFRLHPGGPVIDEVVARYALTTTGAPVAPAEAIRRVRPLYHRDRAALVAEFPAMRIDSEAMGVEATAHVPFPDGSGVLGAAWLEPRTFDDDVRATLEAIADQTGRALARIQRVTTEHRIAQTLQAELLTLDVTTVAAAVAADYRTSSEGVFVGGDWYDAVALRDGRLAVSVGDVVGSGLTAAAAMGKLRSAFTAAALTSPAASDVLYTLDEFARHSPGAKGATAAYGVIDPAAGRLELASAGHPPALLVHADGRSMLLEGGRSWPLGVRDDARPDEPMCVELPPGSLVLLYTDGLVERRGESLDVGLARLVDAAARCWRLPVGMVCDCLLTELLAGTQRGMDDVAILAVRTPVAGDEVYADVIDGEMSELSAARRRFSRWLSVRQLPGGRDRDVVIAVNEAVANAIEHGGRQRPSTPVAIEAGIEPDQLVVRVTDGGSWVDPSDREAESRGRGFTIMRSIADELEVERRLGRTAVTMSFLCDDEGRT